MRIARNRNGWVRRIAILVGTVVWTVLLCNGCVSQSHPPRTEWLTYDQVSAQARRKIQMERDEVVAACGDLIFVGERRTHPPSQDTGQEIHISDPSANYYDRRTGELIAACGYWDCTKNARFCNRYCPLKEWNCRSE
jgi:hypothetical protein